MRQCVLEKPLAAGGKAITVSFIPEEYAVLGKYLKLKDNDVWENGWKVVSVGARRSKDESNKRSRDFLKQRKASDI